MNNQSKAKIFLAEERGCKETDRFRTFDTFNCAGYFDKHKYPFKDLYLFNDNTLAGGKAMKFEVEENSYLILIPVVRSLVFKIDQGNENILHASQLQVVYFERSAILEYSKYYEDDLINFLQVWIKAGNSPVNEVNRQFSFNLDSNKNQLINITGTTAASICLPVISMGKFTGRREALYKLPNAQNHLFVFVIEGVFEVQGRLLHARDALGLYPDTQDIEMEALGNDSIILLVEMKE